MKILEATVYTAYTNSDLDEGRGHEVLIGHFEREADARQAVKGRGVMGTDGWIREEKIRVVVYSSFDEYRDDTDEKDRQALLNRLTLREKRLLGLIKTDPAKRLI